MDRPHGSEQADQALDLTREVFRRFKPLFLNGHLVPTYHGSMLYHDPMTLDVDITFFAKGKVPRVFGSIQTQIEQDLRNLENWPTGECHPNFGQFSLDEIEYRGSTFHHGTKYKFESGEHAAATFAVELLTSGLIYPEQGKELAVMQKKLWEILEHNPTLLAICISEAEDCIQTRQSRRSR